MNAEVCKRGHPRPRGAGDCPQCQLDHSRRRNRQLDETSAALGLSRRDYVARWGNSEHVAVEVLRRHHAGEPLDGAREAASPRYRNALWRASLQPKPQSDPINEGPSPSMSATDRIAARLRQAQAYRRPGLSPSRVHACRRQSAYLLHGTLRTEDVDRSAAELGTILHAGWAALLDGDPDYRTEVTMPLHGHHGPTGQHGTCDWIHTDDARQTITIGDLKTKGASAWRAWRAGPDPDTWDQLHMYAAAVHDGSDAHAVSRGLEPTAATLTWQVQVVAVNRATGEIREWTREADIERGRTLADGLALQEATLLASPPDTAPRDGVGDGFPCDWCEWRTRCWTAPTPPER